MITYRLYELDNQEFEQLVIHICMKILGTGTFSFTTGKDGGRDGRFTGTASKYPSSRNPLSGKFIIQAKHTTNPGASCSDNEFTRILLNERPQIVALASQKELEHYLLFTNRRLTADKENKLRIGLLRIRNLKTASILGRDTINNYLIANRTIWQDLGFDRNSKPFRINPEDLVAVINGFYKTVTKSQFNSATNFTYVQKKSKNRLNKLTNEYYEYIQTDSLPHFDRIKRFLEDPRNEGLKNAYHDAADQLKGKITTFRGQFTTFDEVLTYIHEEIVTDNPAVLGQKRLVRVFLHYMYFDCDIGRHA